MKEMLKVEVWGGVEGKCRKNIKEESEREKGERNRTLCSNINPNLA